MLKKIHKNNYDLVYAVREEKGTIFSKKKKQIKKISDGLIPEKVRDTKNITSRIGLAFVAKSKIIRSCNYSTNNIGFYHVKDQFSFIEVKENNINNSKIKNQLKKLF
jgi:hypothetical protein